MNVVQLVRVALRNGAPGEFPLYSSAQNESPGARWRILSLNMAAALCICHQRGCISSSSINQTPTFEESWPGPHLLLPAAAYANCNPGKRRVEKVDLTGQWAVKTVLIQTFGHDFLWGRSNLVSQRGAQEAADPPADRVSNSICSRWARGQVERMCRCSCQWVNLPARSLAAEEMLGQTVGEANKRSINLLWEWKRHSGFYYSVKYAMHRCVWLRLTPKLGLVNVNVSEW